MNAGVVGGLLAGGGGECLASSIDDEADLFSLRLADLARLARGIEVQDRGVDGGEVLRGREGGKDARGGSSA